MWSVIVCEPQRERKLGEAIVEAGFLAFVPTYTIWRGRHARSVEIKRPLIPGYVFAICPDPWAYRDDGGIRPLPVHPRQAAAIGKIIDEWKADIEAGAYDQDQRIRAPKSRPSRRNRKARRIAGEAKRLTMDYLDGLNAILVELNSAPKPQQVAA